MSQIDVPDPQLIELESLDEAFYAWYQQLIDSDNESDKELAEGYVARWQNITRSNENLLKQINLKWEIVREINEF